MASREYLDSLKRSLTGYLYLGGAAPVDGFRGLNVATYDVDGFSWKLPETLRPLTLLTKGRFDVLERLMERVIELEVPGDFIEAGVFRGGVCIFMRAFLKTHGIDRRVWVADSFEGIPLARDEKNRDEVDAWGDRWVASYETVRDNFMRHGLLDDGVRFLRGYFVDTLETAPIERLALIRLDADSYESTMDALTALYPKLSPGGFVVVDDHHLPGCMRAVKEYRAKHGIRAPLQATFTTVNGEERIEELFWQSELVARDAATSAAASA